MTLDNDTRPRADVTTGILEAYLWQGLLPGKYDAIMDQLLQSASKVISMATAVGNFSYETSRIPMEALKCTAT